MPQENQNTPSELGRLIKRRRAQTGLSMLALARASRVDVSAISRLEHGEFKSLGPDNLRRIAAALGDEVEDYFALAGYAGGLPGLMPYLRTKYGATEETAAQVESYFRYLHNGPDPQAPDSPPDHRTTT